jgi:hypothetical protein
MAKKVLRNFPKGVFVWFEEEGTSDEWMAVAPTFEEACKGMEPGEKRDIAEYNFGYQGKAVIKADYEPAGAPVMHSIAKPPKTL